MAKSDINTETVQENIGHAHQLSYKLEALGKCISNALGDGAAPDNNDAPKLQVTGGDLVMLSELVVDVALEQQRLLDLPGGWLEKAKESNHV